MQLRKLPAGVYVLQLVQGSVEGQVVLVVTDLTAQVKQTDGRVLVRVASSAQQPVADATVTVRRVGGKPLVAKTNDDGEAFVDVDDTQLLITAQRPSGKDGGVDTAIVDTEFFSTLAASPDVFLYTDRPIYRAGDAVQFRGIARLPDGFFSRLFAPKNRSVTVSLVAVGKNDATVASSTTLSVDALGSFTGELKCPDDAAAGVYRVQAMLDGAPHIGEVRVQEYVKPTFFVEVKTESDSVAPGGTIKATIKAERYAGGAPTKTAYEVTLTRTLLEAPSWVDDAGLGGTGSAITYGSKSTTEGKLSTADRLYSSVTERLDAGSADYEDTWKSAPVFDDDGTATIEVPVPALSAGEERLPFKYTLSVRARDDQGTFAGVSTSLFLSPVDVMGTVRFSAGVVRAGETAEVSIRSTTLGGKVAAKTSGSVVFVARNAKGDERELSTTAVTTDDDGVARLPIPTQDIGAVIARVKLLDAKKAEWTGEEELLVVGAAGEEVSQVPELSLTTISGTLSPGDEAQVVAMFPDEWGPDGRTTGPVWLTYSGTRIFQTKRVEVSGHTAIFPVEIDEEFGSAVYVSVAYPTRSGRWEERIVPLRIVPRERV
ncbi:MAG TPA: MG2 domain-containing protein, partial [Myxococcota bacterium]